MLKYNITGKIYNATKALYSNTVSCVKLNGKLFNWLETGSGVRQGYTLSPNLFSLFIDALIIEINKLQLGIKIVNTNIVDDIALVAENESNLQKIFDFVDEWCKNRNFQLIHQKHKLGNLD